MHAQNQSRPMETRKDGQLQVHEIFYTIQGEGPYAGMPAVFVRLSGCNLRCWFCDTNWSDQYDMYVPWGEVVNRVRELSDGGKKTRLVVLTGGEPCRQDCDALTHYLTNTGYTVQVETAGTYWQPWMSRCTIVCSPKTKFVHAEVQYHCQHWKYVIREVEVDQADGLPGEFTQEKDPANLGLPTPIFNLLEQKYGAPARPPNRNVTVWLSPCDEGNPEANQRNLEAVAQSALKYGYRAGVQLHKLMGLR